MINLASLQDNINAANLPQDYNGGHLVHISNRDLFFLGEGQSVDSLDPEDSANSDEEKRKVVEEAVNHAAPLVNPQPIIQVEHLLPLLQLFVSWDR